MKKYIFLIIIAACITFVACDDLELNPLYTPSSGNWFSNSTEIEMSIANLYDIKYYENFRYTTGSGGFIHDLATDDMFYRYSAPSALVGGTINGLTAEVTNWWSWWYECIANANLIIESVESNSDLSEEEIHRYIAQAKFARAVHYSMLIFYYGDVPFYTKTLDIDEATSLTRTDKYTILDVIYEDFDFCIENLPETYSESEYYYATKGAALAMKSRIALYMEDWDIAKDAAKACMDLNIYELYTDFFNLFGQKTYSNKEFIFALPRSIELGNSVWVSQLVDRNSGGYSTYGPSWDLFCSFLCIDGLPIDESPLFDRKNPFKNRDPRCAATLIEFGTYCHGVMYEPHPDTLQVWNLKESTFQPNKNSRGYDQYASYTGLNMRKWFGDDWYDYTQKVTDQSNIVMRYADVLLMYAEAKIELGDIDASVLDAINQVRQRAYNGSGIEYPIVTTTDQSELRKIVRLERRMEFAFEARRYADIIRWKLAEKVLTKPIYGMLDPVDLRENPDWWFFPEVPSIDEDGVADFESMYNKGMVKLLFQRNFDSSKNYLLPIPTSEVEINTNLNQNTGY